MLERLKTFLDGLPLDHLVAGAVTLIVGLLAIKIIRALVEHALNKSKLERAAHSLIRSVLTVVLFLILILMVAEQVGINVTGVIALASVASLAVSLSLQDALGNLIGGFMLLTNHPFKTGDLVEADGQTGHITNVDIFYTHLQTPDGKQVSIPNRTMLSNRIINYSSIGARRVDINVSASYDSDVDRVLEALRRAAAVPDALLDPPPFAAVTKYGDSAIEYVIQVWAPSDLYWLTNFAVNKRIHEEFAADGIIMTYPHLNVHLDR